MDTKCGWCGKKIESSDRPEYVEFRFGKYVTSYSGGMGPYHGDCAARLAKARNEEK